MKKRALLSVSDKKGLVEFARGLIDLGYEIISTGGTAKALTQAGVEVMKVSSVTGFPEILGGRVKTLHPKIHGGILAIRNQEHMAQLAEHDITPIDLVAVNLYPFRETIAKPDVTLAEAIENIDIGGPSMVRSAAKNNQDVIVIVNPDRYQEILAVLKEQGDLNSGQRLALAQEAFAHTASYDTAIANYLDGFVQEEDGEKQAFADETFSLTWIKKQSLRYGENPQQQAAFYADTDKKGACIANARQLNGKELSYNNILDLNAALELVREFKDTPAAAIIKHNNPCGAAVGASVREAYQKALACDPVSAYGGIVACNRTIDQETAAEMKGLFLEAVIAPDFTEEALEILQKKTKLRLLETGSLDEPNGAQWEARTVNGGLLVQQVNRVVVDPDNITQVTDRKPSEQEMKDLIFAMTVVKHVKSNAIVVVKDGQTLGIGAGQMNRVGSAGIAFNQAGEKACGAVLASDAYFPFRDTLDEAAKAGITAVIQPGGSIRDEQSIASADEHNMAMVFTGIRHFRH